ncbi:Uu.00g117950.m01.CDS01 [Anthostomella pinea]|uniref:Uu.00g117950.m01.CDS01 n=1 Tax=Anthostomella pinea TaxID=933095 RepID=A0AAI8VGU8_9PEZI|nr:Uu.00g117950.m01.CDS01 [Anthostomella pinea]
MGQETSHVLPPDTPPQTLSERSIRAVAELIKDGRAKRIVVMTGAGISTAAGIPDFRSPKTGLYNNLARLNLPHPEAVFDIDFFKKNPAPFYVLAKELYPGNFHPTISHAFIALLAKRKLLRMLFTQNIDCLERTAGVPPELIVEAHGSFATQRCIECKTEFPDKEMREHVERGDPPSCIKPGCDGLVKPDIVFFGEQLPKDFYDAAAVPAMADLVIVLGTSLTVHPFAGLPRMAMERTPRLLLNMEQVGDLGSRADDVLCLGECDKGVRSLADELGWRDELEAMWTGIVGGQEAQRQRDRPEKEEKHIEYELLDELVRGVEEKLELSEGSTDDADANLGEQAQEGAVRSQSTSEATAADAAEGDTGARAEKSVGSESTRGDHDEVGEVAVSGKTIKNHQGAEETASTKDESTEVNLGVMAGHSPVQTTSTSTGSVGEVNVDGKTQDQGNENKPVL